MFHITQIKSIDIDLSKSIFKNKKIKQIINDIIFLSFIISMEQDYVSIQETNAGAGLGALIGIFAICFGVFNLAFIIPNLIYAY